MRNLGLRAEAIDKLNEDARKEGSAIMADRALADRTLAGIYVRNANIFEQVGESRMPASSTNRPMRTCQLGWPRPTRRTWFIKVQAAAKEHHWATTISTGSVTPGVRALLPQGPGTSAEVGPRYPNDQSAKIALANEYGLLAKVEVRPGQPVQAWVVPLEGPGLSRQAHTRGQANPRSSTRASRVVRTHRGESIKLGDKEGGLTTTVGLLQSEGAGPGQPDFALTRHDLLIAYLAAATCSL